MALQDSEINLAKNIRKYKPAAARNLGTITRMRRSETSWANVEETNGLIYTYICDGATGPIDV